VNRLLSAVLVFGLAAGASTAFAQSQPPPQTTPPEPQPTTSAEELDIPDVSDTEAAEAKQEDAEASAATPPRDPQAMDPAPADPKLVGVYEQFGEEAGLVALMDDFMVRLVADPRTKPFFENADQVSVKKHLVEQFCVILGGPCAYTGRDMRTAHKGFDIGRSQFNALVELLQQAMSARHIPFRAQNQLLAKLAPLHRDIEHR
jgi:hemoglobin